MSFLTRFGLFQKFVKISVGAPSSPATSMGKILQAVSVLVHSYLRVRYDIPSAIDFWYINGFPKLGTQNPYCGLSWRIRSCTIGFYVHDSCLLLIMYTRPYLAPFQRYSFRQIQRRYIWLPHLRLTPTEGLPLDNMHKNLHRCHRMARIEILLKIPTSWVGRMNITDKRHRDLR